MQLKRRSFTAGLGAVAAAAAMRAGRAAASGTRDTIVIGAGMAGLNAAWLLEQQGQSVMVLEARPRVGGRVLTARDQPGLPELGFNAAAAGYGRTLAAGKRAGVEWVDVAARFQASGAPALFLGGKPYSRVQWAASPLNPFPADLKTLLPYEIVGHVMKQHMPLANWAQWTDPANARLDISMYDFLQARGLSDAAIKLAYDTMPVYGTTAADVSALMLEFNDGWQRTQAAAGPQAYAVKGGNSLLPAAMARLLKGDVLLDHPVAGISSDATGVSVVCANGSSFRARHVVCALPFSTMRRIAFEPGLSGKQARAVATLAYQPLSVAFLTVKSPFWEKDGVNATMWTNGMPGLVLAQHFGPALGDVSGLVVQARGAFAYRWDRLGKAAALASIVATIEAWRPAARGQLTPRLLYSWQAEPYSGGQGAYFGPGQIADFATQMALPAGRIHFAGEHTATANRGVEGAMESSERVAVEILSA